MEDNDIICDRILHIRTTGRDDSESDLTNFPYEPTPYKVLERLVESNYIEKKNNLLDFGCGKGRVDFYLAYYLKCHTIGIELSKILYDRAISNKENAISGNRCEFINSNAKDYIIKDNIDRFYFFNPFSLDILKIVIKRIEESYKRNKRNIILFFYYPSKQYISYLDNKKNIELIDTITTGDLFILNDNREKILVYEIKE